MRPPRVLQMLASLFVLCVLAAACGSDGDTTENAGEEADGTNAEAEDVAEDALEPSEIPEFTVGLLACCTVSDTPMLEAIEVLRDEGYSVADAELAEPELVVEAVATNQFQISQSATTTILLATQQGQPLRAVGERVGNEWLVFSKDDIQECGDLDGARVGIHSEGSSSTTQVRAWIDAVCPDAEPEWLVVAGAPNRVQAMLADQLDATPLQVDNGVDLMNLAPGEFDQLVALLDEVTIRANFYIANQDFMDETPQAIEAWLTTIADIHQQINADPAYLADLIMKHIPDYNEEIVDQVAESYVDNGLFPTDLGLEGMTEDMASTIDFFAESGGLEGLDPDLSPENVLDLGPLEAVLAGETP